MASTITLEINYYLLLQNLSLKLDKNNETKKIFGSSYH